MDNELIEFAKQAIDKCFDSEKWLHTVGCAVRGKSGKIYTGVNIDGIHGSCAEVIALGAAISCGETQFDTIVAVYGKGRDQKIIPPCGNCRQIMFELDSQINVIVDDNTIISIKELLPYPCL